MINIDEDNLKNGVLGLVLAVVEIIRDALQNQANRRIESGTLSEEEVERLGSALADLDAAIEDIKREQGLQQAVQSVRDGLDELVDSVVQTVTGSGDAGSQRVCSEGPEVIGAGR
ncbi:MAG: gas vesicle protein K [Tepidisphaeraceae bacterium]|jgi:hypothetical protein